MSSDAFAFFTSFLKNPRQLGSVIPSSGFLKRRIVRNARLDNARLVVELGPGSGGTTKSILNAMPESARLLSIELNEELYQLGSEIRDSRYIAHLGDATELTRILASHSLPPPDVVISGIPLSIMDKTSVSRLLEVIHQQLSPGGRFVAYQVSDRVDQLNTFFEPSQRTVEVEILNIPPLRVWCWQKAG